MHDLRRPLTRVLVAVDLSPAAFMVLDRAARLPLERGSSLSLLQVVPEASHPSADERGAAVARARRELETFAERLARRVGGGVEIFSSVVVGTPFEEIVRRAHEDAAEVVLLGRHGLRTFADALIGSTAERVLRKGSTPALIIDGRSERPYRRILLAADLSETSRVAAALALRVLHAHDPEVRVIHADDGRAWDVTSGMLRFLEPFQGAGVRWDVVDRRGDARTVILEDAAAWKPDLLVLGTHGRSKVTQQLLGSVADAVIRAAPCDVLVARAPA